MNKEDFYKKFGPKTIWVVPSKENIQTIDDIWNEIESQQNEIKKAIKDFKFSIGLLTGYKTDEFCRNPTDILIDTILSKLK